MSLKNDWNFTENKLPLWSKLEVFYHIVKAGSLVQAAKVLKTDQPMLSSRLATLEKKFGFKLINRSTPHKPLSLTRKGEEVFRVAEQTYMLMREMNTRLYEKAGLKGPIHLNTTHAIANYIISPYLAELLKKHPQIDLELSCSNEELNIFGNEIDIAIRPYIEDGTGLIQEYLFTLQAGLYASREYLDEFGRPQTIDDLDQHRLITFSNTLDNPYAHWSLEAGRKRKKARKPFHTANSVEHLLSAAEAGVGIVSSYEKMLDGRQSKLERVLEDLDGPKFEIFLIYPESVKSIERITKTRNFLKDALGEI